MNDDYSQDPETKQADLVNRRKMLKCMAQWAGTGVVWTIGAGGFLTACGELPTSTPTANPTAVPATNPAMTTAAMTTSNAITTAAMTTQPAAAGFTFVQISDTHIGFNTAGVNTDVNGTLQQTIAKINALPQAPAFVLHTGDITQNSKASEFDTASQLMSTIKSPNYFYVPGEHDVIGDGGKAFRQRFSAKTPDNTWYSLDYQGVHFVGLSNSGELDAFGMLGAEQLAWLQKDLASVKHDTPLVVFAHVPLFTVYQPWSWETKDAAQAIAMLKPYSAVTVLNGHIHQVATQVEGNISFYTANSTAFPQHRPGVEKPNAYPLPANDLLQNLGYRTVNILPGNPTATIADPTLAGTPATSISISSTGTAPTPAAMATAASNPGLVDVGAETDFGDTAANPKKIMLPPAPNGTDPQNAYVVKLDGQYVGLSDICTHQGCEITWVGKDTRFECPCHGSQYDLTGKNVAGPAPKPLSRYTTQIVNGRLLVSYAPVASK